MSDQGQKENYKWNFTVNLMDGASFWIGSSFISASTIIPLFISKLTPSLIPIGLVSVITAAGWFLPQLFSARITESRTKMKRIVIGWGFFLERLPIFVMVISALTARSEPMFALILFLFCLSWHTMGAGVIAPAWMALLAKIFSPRKRGSFLGTTMFIGSSFGIFGSIISAWLLENFTFPKSIVVHFGIAAIFIFISWIFLSLTREPVLQGSTNTQDWPTYKKDLFSILRNDHNFRRYIISAVIITVGASGVGFFTISAIRRFNVSDSTVGLYTFSLLIGQTIGNLVLGWLADKFGHKQSMEIGVAANLIAFILAVIMPSPRFYFIAFFLLGINLSSAIVSSMLVVWEFCPLERVPTYSGLANTAKGIVGLIVPLIAAQIAKMDYRILFGACAIVTLIGLSLLKYWVTEPRWTRSDLLKVE